MIMLQADFTAARLAGSLQKFLHKRSDLLKMAVAARNLYQGDATQKVVENCLQVVAAAGKKKPINVTTEEKSL